MIDLDIRYQPPVYIDGYYTVGQLTMRFPNYVAAEEYVENIKKYAAALADQTVKEEWPE